MINRRAILKAGFFGLGGLTLPDMLTARDANKLPLNKPKAKSAILVWLDGGPSHLESYDPKPDSTAEVRGPFGMIKTSVPGTIFSELLPRQAKLAHHFSVIRSLTHSTGDHFAGGHWMLTGKFGATTANQTPQFPSIGSYVSKMRGPNVPGFPAYVGLPAAQSIFLFPGYMGAAYLGRNYNPFDVDTEQKYLHHAYNVPVTKAKFLSMPAIDSARINDRGDLLKSIDQARRSNDQIAARGALGKFQQQALAMVGTAAVAEAFDISKEDPKLIDRYGNNPWGRYTLMARRLVESGVTFVTVDMPHWDHHSRLVEGHAPNMRVMDQAVGTLIADLLDRGLLDETLVIVMGEFGRTPKVNSGMPSEPIPGRDHWGQVFSVMLAGGGVPGGHIIGASNSRGEYPKERPVPPHDLFSTLYRLLGIDQEALFHDQTGRPIPVLQEGEPIKELI